jgi:hypothetical protein
VKTEPDAKAAWASVPDRRQRPRYRFSGPITARTTEGLAICGISVEISESGMSAMISGLLRVGDTVELEPVAGGKSSAVVRHKLGGLYGLEFVALSAEQARRITETCKKFGVYRGNAKNSEIRKKEVAARGGIDCKG